MSTTTGTRTSPSPVLATGSHILAIDGLRGVAILLVLVFHSTVKAGDTPLDRFVSHWAGLGWVGVDLFFVLSGFLITGILHDSRGSRGYFRTFYARRFLRIFPAYYAVLVGLLIVLPNIQYIAERFGSFGSEGIWYWFYLSNWSFGLQVSAHQDPPDVFWSLAIEEQFYLIWPLVVLLFDRRRLIRICIGLVVLALTFRVVLVLMGAHSLATYVLTPSRIDSLAIGATIALVGREEGGFSNLLRWAPLVAAVSAFVLLAIGVWSGRLDPFSVGMQTVGYTILALFFGACLVIAVATSPKELIVRMLQHHVFRMFGQYSYAIYLCHVPLIKLIRESVYGPDRFLLIMGSTLPGQLLFYLVCVSASLVVAWLSWNLYEKHFLQLKRLFPYMPQ